MVEKAGMKWNNPKSKSGDALLYQIIEKKSHLTRSIHDLLERISRSGVTSKKYGFGREKDYIVYGRESCPFCIDAQKLLDDHAPDNYKFIDIGKNPDLRPGLEAAITAANLSDTDKGKLGFEGGTYPYVPGCSYKGQFIGGLEQLQQHVAK